MEDFLTIDLTYSNYHIIFPRIIIAVLIMLGIILLMGNLLKKRKDNKRPQYRFFMKKYDKVKFYGTIVLLIAYAITLEMIGFILASIIFMVLITLLYIGKIGKKPIITSIANSLATTIVIWYVFGRLFDITLP